MDEQDLRETMHRNIDIAGRVAAANSPPSPSDYEAKQYVDQILFGEIWPLMDGLQEGERCCLPLAGHLACTVGNPVYRRPGTVPELEMAESELVAISGPV